MDRRAAGLLTSFVVLALLATLLALAPTTNARAGAIGAHDYVGAESCRACHKKEFEIWSKGPHAGAMANLRDVEKRDQRCVQCHTMVPADPDPAFAGVQCETCHGAGRYYAKDHVMRDEELRVQLLFAEPSEKTCQRCHTDSSPRLLPFSYAAALERIKHWKDKPAEAEDAASPDVAPEAKKAPAR